MGLSGHITVKRIEGFLKQPPTQEERGVLDNFHAGHSFVDDRTGHNFWTGRDAPVTGAGNNFDGHEPGFPTYVVKLTRRRKNGTATINAKCESESSAPFHP